MLLRGTFFLQVAAQCAFFGRIFFSENLARIFASGSQNLQKFPGIFFALFDSSLTQICPACLLILFHSGDIQVLEKCTQLTSVDFYKCEQITGGCCSEERSFSRLRCAILQEISSLRSLREFSRVARRTCKNISEFFLFLSTSQLLTPFCPPVHHALLFT